MKGNQEDVVVVWDDDKDASGGVYRDLETALYCISEWIAQADFDSDDSIEFKVHQEKIRASMVVTAMDTGWDVFVSVSGLTYEVHKSILRD